MGTTDSSDLIHTDLSLLAMSARALHGRPKASIFMQNYRMNKCLYREKNNKEKTMK